MGLTNFKATGRTKSASHPDWLAASAAVGRMVNSWAGRFDVAAFVAPGAAEGRPAFFNPASSEVEVDATTCFGSVNPDELAKLDDRATQYEWPRATGAIFHEALHARFSLWDLLNAQRELSPAEFKALVFLEESRIEYQGLLLWPRNSGFLRSMALEIVMRDLDEVRAGSDTVTAANIAALTVARVDAGSLDSEDVEAIRDAILAKLGTDRFQALRELWLAAQRHTAHAHAEALYELAREWVRIVTEAAEENGDPAPGEPAPGEPSEFGEMLGELLDEAADSASIAAFGDITDAQMFEDWEREAAAKNDAAKERKVDQSIASEVFGKGTAEMQTTSSGSTLHSKRAPSGEERAAAVQIARSLDKAKYRDRDATEITSIVPPGRLRTRAAVQGAALRSKGVVATSEPWRRTVRKHTDDPTLTVGVMVDISGSMGGAMEPMAVAAWVLSESVRRVQGRAAMVYYGSDVFPTLKPGQHLSNVNVWTAPDGTEKFDKGFKAINGALGLTHGTGARLLVIVSDGCYTGVEKTATRRALERCRAAGVGVLWLSFGDSYEARALVNGTGAVMHVVNGGDVTAAAHEIGAAAARALESAH